MITDQWKKARESFSNGACVQVKHGKSPLISKRIVLVRDSKNPGTVLAFTGSAWNEFLREVKC